MKKLLFILFVLSLSSCVRVNPAVSIKNDIHLTIDGENINGIQGEWIITTEKKEKKEKKIIIITIEKNETN